MLRRPVTMLAFYLSVHLTLGTLCAQEPAEIPPLVIPMPAQVAAARAEVRTAITAALDRYDGDSKHAAALSELNAVLAEREATVEEAEPIANGLSDGRGHLALPEYVTLREKMFRYVAQLRATTEADLEAKYREHVEGMRRAVAEGKHDELTVHIRWLAQRDLAKEERLRVAEASSCNNVVVRLASTSGNRLLPNPYTQSFRQTTDMEGTPAVITGNLTAYSSFYKPANGASANHAGLDVRATVRSNVAMSRPKLSATANGNTQIFARVLLEVQNNEFRVAGTTFTSRTNMCLSCVDTASNRRVVDRAVGRLAGKVFDRRRGEINSQADQQITAQGKPEMLKQVEMVVTQINLGKQELFAPMVAYGISPDMFLGSDPDGLNMEFRVASPDQLAAPCKPAPVASSMSQLAVHDSAANNFGAMFAGATLDEQRFRESVFDSLGFTPVDLAEPPGGEIAHELTFSRSQPLVVRFEDGVAKVHAQINQLKHGEEVFKFEKPVTADVVYRFTTTDVGVRLVREALTSDAPGESQPKLEATLDRFFVPLAEQDDITTLGQMLTLLQLKPGQPVCEQGWLQMPLVDR